MSRSTALMTTPVWPAYPAGRAHLPISPGCDVYLESPGSNACLLDTRLMDAADIDMSYRTCSQVGRAGRGTPASSCRQRIHR